MASRPSPLRDPIPAPVRIFAGPHMPDCPPCSSAGGSWKNQMHCPRDWFWRGTVCGRDEFAALCLTAHGRGRTATKFYRTAGISFKADGQAKSGVSLCQRPLFVIRLSTRTAASRSVTVSFGSAAVSRPRELSDRLKPWSGQPDREPPNPLPTAGSVCKPPFRSSRSAAAPTYTCLIAFSMAMAAY